jgi:kinetochore protein Spc7/SPC105
MTADIGALPGRKRDPLSDRSSKKSRSKSIGPGGLDALRDTTGNRRKVCTAHAESELQLT